MHYLRSQSCALWRDRPNRPRALWPLPATSPGFTPRVPLHSALQPPDVRSVPVTHGVCSLFLEGILFSLPAHADSVFRSPGNHHPQGPALTPHPTFLLDLLSSHVEGLSSQ